MCCIRRACRSQRNAGTLAGRPKNTGRSRSIEDVLLIRSILLGNLVTTLACASTTPREPAERWAPAAVPEPPAVDSRGKRAPAAAFRGFALFGRELHGFKPCGSAEVCWLELTEVSVGRERLALKSTPGCYPADDLPGCDSSLYVELDGSLNELTRAGHMGRYGRVLRVRELFYVANVGPRDCALSQTLQPRR
jgi:hypothetical protein